MYNDFSLKKVWDFKLTKFISETFSRHRCHLLFFLNMLTVVILAWSSSKISYQTNVCGKCHGKSKFMKGWRSYYGELLWGLLHQHPTRTDAAMPLTRIHATFFFFFFLLLYSRQFALDCDKLDFGRNGPPLCRRPPFFCFMWPWEREREKGATSCALTWNYDRESKVESCGVDRFLNRCIGIRENFWKR